MYIFLRYAESLAHLKIQTNVCYQPDYSSVIVFFAFYDPAVVQLQPSLIFRDSTVNENYYQQLRKSQEEMRIIIT